MKTSFYKEFKDRTLFIPKIQRDYVQPLDKKVITPFVERIILALKGAQEYLDLNYIYGIKNEDSSFEPIDGQQRITTIWLLYIYLSALCSDIKKPEIILSYNTRENTQDFTSALINNFSNKSEPEEENSLRAILKTYQLPSTLIKDAAWFRDSWSEDISVSGMLITLDVIFEALKNEESINILYDSLISSDSILFAFKETKNLGDDIYVKMNARGKALTSFENLKAWLNENLSKKLDISKIGREPEKKNVEFYNKWCNSVDNQWLNLFWNNRNMNNSYPEEIDDSILRFFYTLLWCFWIGKKEEERVNLLGSLKNDKFQNLNVIAKSLDIKEMKEEDNATITFVQRVLSKFLESKDFDIQLYILDKLDLFPLEFYEWAQKVIDGMCKNVDSFNDLNSPSNPNHIWFWDEPKQKLPIKLFTQLMLEEVNKQINLEKALLCLSFAYYSYQEKPVTSLNRWMYHCRNLIYNFRNKKFQSDIADNLDRLVRSLIKASDECSKVDVDVILSIDYDKKQENHNTIIFKEFSKLIEEEQLKAKIWLYHKDWFTAMHTLEENNFFRGHISFLFQFLGSDLSKINSDDFIKYCQISYQLFALDTFRGQEAKERLLHRALLTQGSHYGIGYYNESGAWTFMKYPDEWQIFFRDTKENHNESIGNLLHALSKYIIDSNYTIENIENSLRDIIKHSDVRDWRRFFIEDHRMWQAMHELACRWNNDYDIKLIPRYKLGKYRADLRAYYFWRQFRTNHADRDSKMIYLKTKDGQNYKYKKWNLNFYNQNWTCLFVDRKYKGYIIAIDVAFNTGKKSEDAYVLQLFVRDKEIQTQEEYIERNKLIPDYLIEKYKLKFNGQRNEITDLSFARAQLLLINLVEDLNKELWHNI